MKFYVTSGFANKDKVRCVSERLKSKGFTHTYDWTKNKRASTVEALCEIGQQEKNAVLDVDFFIVLLPAGKGSHMEFGIALGQGKKYICISLMKKYVTMKLQAPFIITPKLKSLLEV